jgi:hypothetical protein
MPIYYACDSEEQAKELCSQMNGQYMGCSALYGGRFTWHTHTGCCITSFVTPSATGFDRFMVVYNQEAEAFERIAIDGDAAAHGQFFIGGALDASAELRTRYTRNRYEHEDARSKAKELLLNKARSIDKSRLRKIKSKMVVVVDGKIIKQGTSGRVFWTGYGERGEARIGFNDVNGQSHFIALKNVCEANDLPLLPQAC